MEAIFFCTTALSFAMVIFLLNYLFRNQRRLHLPPSPGLALPVIGHLYLMKAPVYQTLAKLSARYGPILLLRFGSRPVLVVSSVDLAMECFTTNDVVFANRPPLLSSKHFGYNESVLVTAPYGPHWRNLRRIAVQEILSISRIEALSDDRAAELRFHLRHLYEKASNGNFTVDMATLFFELTMNTSMRMISGKSYCGEGATVGAMESRKFVKCIKEVFYMSKSSNLEDFVPLLRWVTKLEKKMVTLGREMDGIFQDMVDEHRRKKKEPHNDGVGEKLLEDRKTFIDVLVELQHAQPDYYTDELIKGMISIIILGATETSSRTMEWAMALLLNNPTVLEKAIREIDMHVEQDRLVTEQDLPNLPYVANVIRETLRLFPPGVLPHFSSDECTVGGFDVPRGTMLVVNIYEMQRDPKIWKDPEEFRPGRFEDEVEGCKSIPFGVGRRRCPGDNLAMKMMLLTLANMLKCFIWERIGEKKVDLTVDQGATVSLANPLIAKYRPRPSMINVLSQL